jgi:glycosyltransferase involved in cell wall biosynthesis
MTNYDLNIFLSNKYRDYDFAVNNSINNNVIIPNGASYTEFTNSIKFDIKSYLNINNNDKLIIHVGSYTGEKGHQEAIKIFLKSKINNYSLLFIGDNFENNGDFLSNFNWFKYINYKTFFKYSSLKSLKIFCSYFFSKNKNKIFYCSLKRQELVATYLQSDILLFPSKIECSPLVVYEAMASKTICLATDVGNVKEIFELSEYGIVLPTKIKKNGYSYVNINKSSKILFQIANQSNFAMLEKGYNFWKINNTWEAISLKYEQIYKNLMN